MDSATIALITAAASIAIHLIQMIAAKWFPKSATPVVPVLPAPANPSSPAFGQGLLQFVETEGVKFLQSLVGSGTQAGLKAGALYALKQFVVAMEQQAQASAPAAPKAA